MCKKGGEHMKELVKEVLTKKAARNTQLLTVLIAVSVTFSPWE